MTARVEQETLVHDLHVLVARLDLAAERILRDNHGTTYARYRALLGVDLLPDPVSQRDLAAHLAVSEAAASRMVRSLEDARLLTATSSPGGGRRRTLSLTPGGDALRQACAATLEGRFAGLLAAAGIDNETYGKQTRILLDLLGTPSGSAAPPSHEEDAS